MTITSNKKNTKLWKRIVNKIKKSNKGGKPGQWSARKAQICVKLYKSSGGKYSGKKQIIILCINGHDKNGEQDPENLHLLLEKDISLKKQ